ncbi:MAG: hypothetical protein WBD99_10260 [Thermodesulfobacteriota bacterium]
MKTFVRVFIILGAIGAMVLAAVPALAGVGPPAEDALCLADCADAFGECKSTCAITCPECAPDACSVDCGNELIVCVATEFPVGCGFVPRPRCGNLIVEAGEQCDPPGPGGAQCSALRFCNVNCRCVPVGPP